MHLQRTTAHHASTSADAPCSKCQPLTCHAASLPGQRHQLRHGRRVCGSGTTPRGTLQLRRRRLWLRRGWWARCWSEWRTAVAHLASPCHRRPLLGHLIARNTQQRSQATQLLLTAISPVVSATTSTQLQATGSAARPHLPRPPRPPIRRSRRALLRRVPRVRVAARRLLRRRGVRSPPTRRTAARASPACPPPPPSARRTAASPRRSLARSPRRPRRRGPSSASCRCGGPSRALPSRSGSTSARTSPPRASSPDRPRPFLRAASNRSDSSASSSRSPRPGAARGRA